MKNPFTIILIANYLILTWEKIVLVRFFGTQPQTVRAQAVISPLVWRTGEQLRSFALAEHERFKRVVAQRNLSES